MTDKKYYKDNATGSYYGMEGDVLIQYPMLEDGTMEENPIEVDPEETIFDMPILYEGEEIDLYQHLIGIREYLVNL